MMLARRQRTDTPAFPEQGPLRRLLEQLAKMPETAFLLVNAGLAGFVGFAHGMALLFILSGGDDTAFPAGFDVQIRRIAAISLPMAALTLVSSGAGLARPALRPAILGAQAIVVLVSGLVMLGWGVTLVVRGLPPGNFGWTPGLLTAWVAYGFLSTARFVLPRSWAGHRTVIYAPVAGALLTAPIDVGVFLRLLVVVAW